jgi:hypothetical protein
VVATSKRYLVAGVTVTATAHIGLWLFTGLMYRQAGDKINIKYGSLVLKSGNQTLSVAI